MDANTELYLVLFAVAVASAVYLIGMVCSKISGRMQDMKNAIAPDDPYDQYWHDKPS